MGKLSGRLGSVVSAAIAAGLAAAIESWHVLTADGFDARPFDLGSACLVWGLAYPAAFLLAGSIRLVAALSVATGPARGWWRDLAAGDGARSVAVWRAVLGSAAVITLGAACALAVAGIHQRYGDRASAPFAVLVAVVVVLLAVAVLVAAIAADRRLAPRIASSPGWQACLRGRRLAVVGVGAAVAACATPLVALRVAVPAVSIGGALAVAAVPALVAACHAVRLDSRRGARSAAAVLMTGWIGCLWLVSSSSHARSSALIHGEISRVTLRVLWSLADRDGDGYPGASVGGADCDDADPRIGPRGHDLPGNGVDENCSGADALTRASGVPEPAAPAASTPRPNILLISVDALRADRLGAWGYPRPTSPSLDRLAAGSARFEWTFTSSPTTRRAIPSLFTGRHGSSIEWSQSRRPRALAELLAEAGYDTAAITCCRRFALAERELTGFRMLDTVADETGRRQRGEDSAEVVASRAAAWLRSRAATEQPFLLWLHFYDPHMPYLPPERRNEFGSAESDRYDAEIRYTDRHIGAVLDELAARGLADRTVVVVTADHGEELGEHGIRFHARSLFNPVVRVPLIVRVPGAPPRQVATPVSLVDVMPTILSLAGVAQPPGISGRSLAEAIVGDGRLPDRPVVIELAPDRQIERDMVGLVAGGWKLVWDRDANAWSLYSLAADPQDRHDRAASEPAVVARLRAQLRERLDVDLGPRRITRTGTAARR